MRHENTIIEPENDALSALMEPCCDVLESELQRQRCVLDACKAQGRAARARDVEAIEDTTRDLVVLIEAAVVAEKQRQHAFALVVEHLGLRSGDQTLSAVIRRSPEPWRSRLTQLQRDMKETLAITKRLVHTNRRYLGRGARAADRLVSALFGKEENAAGYDRAGREPDAAARGAAVLNTAG